MARRHPNGHAHRLHGIAELVIASYEIEARTRGQLDPSMAGSVVVTSGHPARTAATLHITETRPRGKSSCPLSDDAFYLAKVRRVVEASADWQRELLRGVVARRLDDPALPGLRHELLRRLESITPVTAPIRAELCTLMPAVAVNLSHDLAEIPRITLPHAAELTGVAVYYQEKCPEGWKKKIDNSLGHHWSRLHGLGAELLEGALTHVEKRI